MTHEYPYPQAQVWVSCGYRYGLTLSHPWVTCDGHYGELIRVCRRQPGCMHILQCQCMHVRCGLYYQQCQWGARYRGEGRSKDSSQHNHTQTHGGGCWEHMTHHTTTVMTHVWELRVFEVVVPGPVPLALSFHHSCPCCSVGGAVVVVVIVIVIPLPVTISHTPS